MDERAEDGLPTVAWIAAGLVVMVLLLFAGAYGFHRDEMYFILAGRHPDFGYVDQPPLTPLLSAAAAWLLGVTPLAIRILPALAAGAVVVLTADIARRLGASRTGQALAAVVVGISGVLGAGHLDETTTYDVLFWTLTIWLLIPALDTRATSDSRWRWLAIGLVVGIALENKTLAIALPATVGAGLLLLRRWDILRSPWPWVAALIAIVLWLPNLTWQATHGWTQLTMAANIASDQGGLDGRLKSIVELMALAGLLLFPVSISGIAWLLRATESRPWRPLGLAIVLQLGLMLLIGGKSYYSAGYIPLAIAAGSIPLGRAFVGWQRRRRLEFALTAAVSGTVLALLLLPIVPVTMLHATPIPGIYEESVAQVGWPELAAQVESVAAGLPPAELANAVIVTANYGQYGAMVLLGHDLPPAYSGHNSVADWGTPPDGAAPVILVGWSPGYADTVFAGCRTAAVVDNGLDLQTRDQGSPILVCDGPRQAWSQLWPQLRHID